MKHDQWFRLFFKSSRYLCYMTSSFHLCSWLNYRLLIDIIFTHIILQIFLLNVDILRFQGKSEPSWPTFLDSDLQHTSSSAFRSAIKTNIIPWWPWVLFFPSDFWSSGLCHIAPWSEFSAVRLLHRSSPTFTRLVFPFSLLHQPSFVTTFWFLHQSSTAFSDSSLDKASLSASSTVFTN